VAPLATVGGNPAAVTGTANTANNRSVGATRDAYGRKRAMQILLG